MLTIYCIAMKHWLRGHYMIALGIFGLFMFICSCVTSFVVLLTTNVDVARQSHLCGTPWNKYIMSEANLPEWMTWKKFVQYHGFSTQLGALLVLSCLCFLGQALIHLRQPINLKNEAISSFCQETLISLRLIKICEITFYLCVDVKWHHVT